MATSSYNVYMMDAPKENNSDDKENPVENKPLETQQKHQRPRHRSKSRHSKDNNTSTGEDNTPDDEDPVEEGSEQEEQEGGRDSLDEQATYGDSEDSNYLPPSEEEEIIDN